MAKLNLKDMIHVQTSNRLHMSCDYESLMRGPVRMTEGDDAESDFEARLAKLKKRPGSGKSGAQTPYQQLKQNQAEQKDRSLLGALHLAYHLPISYSAHALVATYYKATIWVSNNSLHHR